MLNREIRGCVRVSVFRGPDSEQVRNPSEYAEGWKERYVKLWGGVKADSQIRIGEMGRIIPTRFHDESELRVDVFYRFDCYRRDIVVVVTMSRS